MAGEGDPQLRRIERTALIICVTVAVFAVLTGGGWAALLGVAGGALLVAVSWRAVRAGVDAALLAAVVEDSARRRQAVIWRSVRFIARFAILALLAYVMMVRLRAHPLWMLAGATSLVAAAGIEAFRQLRARL